MNAATHPLVRVAVLNWNGGEMTRRCFDHLVATDYPADRLELVLVDNASVDGSVEAVRSVHPQVRVLQNGANLGFVGLNAALRDPGRAEYVALINNDAFVEPDWLAPLVGVLASDPGLGAAAPKMVFAPRFTEVVIERVTGRATLGGDAPQVRVSDVHVGGSSVWDSCQFVAGVHGPESDASGRFRRTGGRAVVRVPVADPGRDPGVSTLPTPDLLFASLELAADVPSEVELSCGAYRLRAEVGPTPRVVRVPLDGQPFDVIQNAGSVLIEDGFGADRGFMAIDEGQFDAPCEVVGVCGGAVLLRSVFLAHAGVLDDRFFLYYEDTDLSWRGRRLGWRYAYVPTSVVRHVHGASAGDTSDVFAFHVERNRLLMLAKNAPWGLALRQAVGFGTATASYARRDVLPALRAGRRPPMRLVRNRTRSFLSFLGLAPAMLVDRRATRRRQQVDDVALLAGCTTRAGWTLHERRVVESAGTRRPISFPPWSGEPPPEEASDRPGLLEAAVP